MSLFAADQRPPEPADLAGLLAAHGQSVLSGGAGRISVVVDASWRAELLAQHIAQAGLRPLVSAGESVTVSTEPTRLLAGLVLRWRTGAAASVPRGWVPTAGQVRLWVLAAGAPAAPAGYALGVDPAVGQHDTRRDALLSGLSGAGLAATYVGPRGGGPYLRIVSERRLLRLRETVGARPDAAPPALWP